MRRRGARRTGGVAGVGAEGQDLDKFIVGAGGQQLPAVAPGHAVDGALVVFVPPEADRRLLGGADGTKTGRISEANVCTGRHRRTSPPGAQRLRVGADSQGFGVGAHGVKRSRGVEGHGTHRLRVLQLVHPHER